MHVQNKKYRNFVSRPPIARLTGKLQHKNFKTFAVLVYGHVYIIMVILRSQNKITDFFMILA